ncbi:C47 family peptidase (plasmid) [Lactococcus garvieae]|uniref:C47 family peptidase n=1 Tax=Lactococcus garvieae TaxID=1363 RepID=UPI00311ADA4A
MKIKHLKMKAGVLLSTVILLATATVPNAFAFSIAESEYNQDGISVNIKQIKELADNDLLASDATPSQALAQTIATLVSKDPSGDNGNFTEVLDANDVLKYFYPDYTEDQLKGATITTAQAVEWLNSKGYAATVVNRPLTTEEIKTRLDNSEPIVPVLENQNPDNWLNKNYAGVLYAHDDVETGTAEGKLHASFIKTVNYGEAIINDGAEAEAFQFPDLKNAPDPTQAESSFKWVSTLTGIKRDPSWTNAQTIQGDKAKGVFEHKITSDGSQSQVDFTDPDVMALLNKYPDDNKDHVSKLAAVALINLYEDKDHQKTVKDLEEFLKIDTNTYVTSQNIMDWYEYLGFDFDVVNGRAPMELTKAINDSGRLYLTTFKPKDSSNPVKSTVALGTGYLKNSFNGYRPYWATVKMVEQLIPFYDTPMTEEGMAQQQELAQTFNYSTVKRVVNDPFSKTDYEEDKTIYNIRLKGTPDESGITIEPDESVETQDPETTDKPTTNATYNQAPDFKIRETQGQQPWCTAYVNAGAVNTASHAGAEAVTSAKDIMKLDRPGVSDEELENLPGTTVGHMLDVIKENYGVTADYEERTLSFEEVKKEIDAGGIIEMDGYNSEDPEGPGNGGSGHAVSIVGYVEPTESGKPPYYIVWNPWWNTTFYLSSQAKTFNLGGVKYKWYRTWHNWRKVDGTRAEQALDPKLRDKKVASASNPYPTKEDTFTTPMQEMRGLNTNLLNFNSNKDILSSRVSQFGAEIRVYTPGFGIEFGYSHSLDDEKKYIRARYNNQKPKTVSYGNGDPFADSVDSLIDLGDELQLTSALTWAYYTAAIIVAITCPELAVIVGVLESLGVVVSGISVIEAARLVLKYVNTVNTAKSQYNGLTSIN